MAEKTDKEIIEELKLETSDDASNNEVLEEVSSNVPEDILEEVTKIDDASTINEQKKQDANINETKEKVIEDTVEEVQVQKKQPKIFRILIGVLIFLVTILVIGLILFFTGFFDPEEQMNPETNETKKPVAEQKIKEIEKEIHIKDLDKNRLNKKLQMLTKTEIMHKEELEAEEKKIAEEKKKKEEAKQKALDEKKKLEEEKEAAKRAEIQKEIEQLKEHQENVKKQQEEFLKLQNEAKMQLEEQRLALLKEIEEEKNKMPAEPTMVEEEKIMTEETKKVIEQEEVKEEFTDTKNTFLQFINVATVKGNLYKSYLDKVQIFDKNPSLCRDSKNRIEIYFGPYDSEKQREKVLNNLMDNGFKESYLVDFTQEEYEKRCKY